MSQTDLAHKLGKSFNMVNLYATNRVQPPIPVLYEIAEILKVDVRDLLTSNINNKEIWQIIVAKNLAADENSRQ